MVLILSLSRGLISASPTDYDKHSIIHLAQNFFKQEKKENIYYSLLTALQIFRNHFQKLKYIRLFLSKQSTDHIVKSWFVFGLQSIALPP